MDIEPNITTKSNGTLLTDFATGEVLHEEVRPKLQTLKEVLIAQGASAGLAASLASSDTNFIPVRRKYGAQSFACKKCGKKHPRWQQCTARAVEHWRDVIERTGWGNAFSTWVGF